MVISFELKFFKQDFASVKFNSIPSNFNACDRQYFTIFKLSVILIQNIIEKTVP